MLLEVKELSKVLSEAKQRIILLFYEAKQRVNFLVLCYDLCVRNQTRADQLGGLKSVYLPLI